MSTQSDSEGSSEERWAGKVGEGVEQLEEEACLTSKQMSAKLAAKELETLQVIIYFSYNEIY